MPLSSPSAVAEAPTRRLAADSARTMPPPTRRWHRRLLVHVLAYAALLAVVTAILPLGASLTSDDGAYGGHVFAMQQGAWELDRPLPVVAEANEGWANAAISPNGPLPYTANPSYAVLLRASADAVAAVSGSTPATGADNALGMQLIPVTGALGAAIMAWLLTSHWNPTAGPLAFWLVAVGPTLVNATSLWAHTLSSALAGAALLMLIKLLAPAGPVHWRRTLALIAALALALSAAALIRTESVFWIASMCLSVVFIYRSRLAIAAAGLGGGLSAVAWLGNRWWGLSIRSDRLPIKTGPEAFEGGWLQSRIPAGWELLVTSLGSGAAVMPLVIAVVLIGYAGFKIRAGHHPKTLVPILVGAAGLYVVVPFIAPGQFLAGTIAASPVVFFVLWATATRPNDGAEDGGDDDAGRADDATRAARNGLTLFTWSSLGFIVVVLATQYAGSGGLQWGGRYLSMAYVPLAVAAALRAETVYRQLRLPLLALLVVPTAVGLLASRTIHENHEAVVDVITEYPAEVVITDQVPLARLAWPALPTTVYLADSATAEALMLELADAGVDTITLWGIDSLEVDDGVAGFELAARNRHVTHLVRTP